MSNTSAHTPSVVKSPRVTTSPNSNTTLQMSAPSPVLSGHVTRNSAHGTASSPSPSAAYATHRSSAASSSAIAVVSPRGALARASPRVGAFDISRDAARRSRGARARARVDE